MFWKVRAMPARVIACWGMTRQLFPIQNDLSCIERVDAGEQVENGGLACAVRTDDPYNIVIVHLKGKIVYRFHTAECLGEAFNFQRTHSALAPFRKSCRRKRSEISCSPNMPLGRKLRINSTMMQ